LAERSLEGGLVRQDGWDELIDGVFATDRSRKLGVEPEGSNLDELLTGTDELQVKGTIGGRLGGWVVVSDFEAVGGAGADLAVHHGVAVTVNHATENARWPGQ
jgi:hypothetical protein